MARHPIFARCYQRVAAAAEVAGAAEHRQRLLDGLEGHVVEVGAGNGLNFAHYPERVRAVIAVEPEPYLRARAEEAAQRVSVPVNVVDGDATRLPVDDGSADAVVMSLVLCSVPAPDLALREAARVLRPNGSLRFYEHVLATDTRWARRQRLADPIWKWFAGGCHLTRDTLGAIRDAGFVVDECDEFLFAPCAMSRLAAPHILGAAHKLAA